MGSQPPQKPASGFLSLILGGVNRRPKLTPANDLMRARGSRRWFRKRLVEHLERAGFVVMKPKREQGSDVLETILEAGHG